MAGLLGDSWDDPKTLGVLAAAGALASGRPLGQGLLGAVQAYSGLLGEGEERASRKAYRQAQTDEIAARAQERQMQIEQAQRQSAAVQAGFGGMSSGQQSQDGSGQTAGLPFDPRPLIAAGVPPERIQQYAALQNIGRSEVARTIKSVGADGREVEVQLDKFGQPVGQGLPQYRAPLQVNQGNQNTFLDPYSLKPVASLAINQSADSQASNALGWANNALSRQRLALDQTTARAEGATKGAPSGYMWNGKGGLMEIPGGPAAQEKPLNDTQGKALLFGSRMKAADNIIGEQAGKGTLSPGYLRQFGEALPGWALGGVVSSAGNMIQSSGEQQVEQAQRDFINATLRRESGAAIGKDEFSNARKQYFPQPGDSAAVIAQKAANRELATAGILAEVPGGRTLPGAGVPSASGGFKIIKVE